MSAPDNIPDRFMAWHGPHPLPHAGTWATTRYPANAVEYLRATPAREHAEELAEALREQVFFHAMTLSLRRQYMEPDEVKDVEFRRDRARTALAKLEKEESDASKN